MSTAVIEKEEAEIIKNLKIKCNLQIDQLIAKDRELKECQREIKRLKENLKKDVSGEVMNNEELHNFVNEFVMVIKAVLQQNAIVPYRYDGKEKSEFVNVDSDEFERFVGLYSDMDVNKFLKYGAMFRLIGIGTAGQKKAWVGKTWCYKISKKMVEYIGKDIPAEEELAQ